MKKLLDRLSDMTFAQFFALIIVFCCFAYFVWISKMAINIKDDLPTDISEIKMSVIGAFSLACAYILGSSNSSSKKDATIDKAIDKTGTTNNTTNNTTNP